jgi:hypothetical protein
MEDIYVEALPGGRKLTPVGDIFKLAPQELSKMSRDELKSHIQLYKSLVDEAQRSLDYRRTRLAMAQNESEYREAEDRRKLRATRPKFLPGNKVKLRVATNNKYERKSPGELFADQIEQMRAKGMSDIDIFNELAKLVHK